MLRLARGRRAIARAAQIAGVASSAMMAFSAVALAAEPGKNNGNGRLVGGTRPLMPVFLRAFPLKDDSARAPQDQHNLI